MEEYTAVEVMLGLALFYAVIHFIVLQFKTTWVMRTTYEQIITVIAIIVIAIALLA